MKRSLLFVAALLAIAPSLRAEVGLEDRLYNLADDPDPRVRFQLALTLGELSGPGKIAALKKIALQDCDDYWVRTAILSSLNEDAFQLFEALLTAHDNKELRGCRPFLSELSRVLGTRAAPEEIGAAIGVIFESRSKLEPDLAPAALSGLAEGIELSGKGKVKWTANESALLGLLNDSEPAIQSAAQRLAGLLERKSTLHTDESIANAIRIAKDPDFDRQERKRALDHLKGAALDSQAFNLCTLLEAVQPDDLALMGLDVLNSLSDEDFSRAVVSCFERMSPTVKEKALDALFARTGRLLALLQAISAGELDKLLISRDRRPALLVSPNKEVADLASSIYGELNMEEDLSLFEKYRPAMDLPGDPEKGHTAYKARCVFCHKVGEEGVNLGPDWTSVKNNTRDALLINILYPNRDIDPGFLNYAVETTDGRLITGILVSSGEASLTLRRAGGEEDTVLRKNIETLRNTELSIMPLGLEAGLTPEDMADLLAFIQSIQ